MKTVKELHKELKSAKGEPIDLIEIKQDAISGAFAVLHEKSVGVTSGYSEGGNPAPNSNGFYYYPRSLGKETAFADLKNKLIGETSRKIAELQDRLVKLTAIQL